MERTIDGIPRADLLRFLYQKFGSYFRFAVVGTVNTGIDFLIFVFLLRVVGINYLVAQAASYGIGVINSFLMNKVWTFDSAGPAMSVSGQFVRFITVNVLSLAISLAGLTILSGYLGVNVYLSKIAVLGITQFVSYMGYKYLVFKSRGSIKGCETL